MLRAVRSASEKPREERRSVALPARLRAGSGWDDACILNVSSRGLMVYSPSPAKPGSYVELWRGDAAIVARVVWRRNNRIGLRSQERLRVAQIITGSQLPALQIEAAGARPDRRRTPRFEDESRIRGRLAQFLCVSLLGAALATAAYATVATALAQPVAKVAEALGG